MRQLIAYTLSILGFLFMWSVNASAADLPGTVQPGQIERQFQPEPTMRADRPERIVTPEPDQPVPSNAKDIRFRLTGLAIEGATVYSEKDLLPAGNNVNVNDYIVTNNGAINLFAAAGMINLASGKLVYAGTAPITVRSGGTLTNASYLTSGLLSLISTQGSVNIDNAIDPSIGNLLIQAAGDVNVNQPIVNLSDGNTVNVSAGNDIKVSAQIDGRPALDVNPNGAVTMTAGQNIHLYKSILAHSINLTATLGAINAPTMKAGTVTIDPTTGIPEGVGLFSGNGPISVTSGGNFSSGIYVTMGPVFIEREKASIPAKMSDQLFEKDIIVTGESGSMGAVLIDNSVTSSGPNTRLILSQFVFDPAEKKLSSTVQIMRGTMIYLSGLIAKHDSKAVKFVSPTAVCGLRGTHLAIQVEYQ